MLRLTKLEKKAIRQSSLQAFTLLELILVIAIISVLAGLVIFNLRPADILKSANDVKTAREIKQIEDAIKAYALDHDGNYPSAFGSLASGTYDLCLAGQSGCTANSIDLQELVTEGYLNEIPKASDCASVTKTCLQVTYDPTSLTVVVAEVPLVTPIIYPPLVSLWDDYQGGKVFYILQPSDFGYDEAFQKGLIVAPSDQGIVSWGCAWVDIPGATGVAIGTGLQNTLDMVADGPGCTRASDLVYGININGYSDWYVPSADEMNLICQNRSLIGGLPGSSYWTSSEFDASYTNFIPNGYAGFVCGIGNSVKGASLSVRAIRSFAIPRPIPEPTPVSIGGDYQGGKIAYLLQPGDAGYDENIQKGLIVSYNDLSGAYWGCYGTNVSGADGTTVGTGSQNTLDLLGSGCSSIVGMVHGITINGYSDWYIPSIAEMTKICENRSLIGGLPYSRYWTSSEAGLYWAYHVNPSVSCSGSGLAKNGPYMPKVRPVRSFFISNP